MFRVTLDAKQLKLLAMTHEKVSFGTLTKVSTFVPPANSTCCSYNSGQIVSLLWPFKVGSGPAIRKARKLVYLGG